MFQQAPQSRYTSGHDSNRDITCMLTYFMLTYFMLTYFMLTYFMLTYKKPRKHG